MWTGRLTEKNDTAGADDIASLRFNSGLEHPPHPGASETAAKICILFRINNHRGLLTRLQPLLRSRKGGKGNVKGKWKKGRPWAFLCSRRTGTVRADDQRPGRTLDSGRRRPPVFPPSFADGGRGDEGNRRRTVPCGPSARESVSLFQRQALQEGRSHVRTARPLPGSCRLRGTRWPPGAPPSRRLSGRP